MHGHLLHRGDLCMLHVAPLPFACRLLITKHWGEAARTERTSLKEVTRLLGSRPSSSTCRKVLKRRFLNSTRVSPTCSTW